MSDGEQKQRAAFEAWWIDEGQFLDEKAGESVYGDCWLGWQACAAQTQRAPEPRDQRAIEDMRQWLQMPSKERKAAIRYMWLRDANNWSETGIVVCSGNGEDTIYGEHLDKAIDAEILAASPTPPETPT